MSDKPDKTPKDRFHDGMIISIGGTVVADSEADAYGVASKVGQTMPMPPGIHPTPKPTDTTD